MKTKPLDSDTIKLATNPDGTFKAGSGYVVAPYLRTLPFYRGVSNWDRLPLDDTNTATASVKPFEIQVELAADNITDGALLLVDLLRHRLQFPYKPKAPTSS